MKLNVFPGFVNRSGDGLMYHSMFSKVAIRYPTID
jgi:hypothetical protein